MPSGAVMAFEVRPVYLALDVEVADFAEVEQLLVEVGPVGHAAAVHVVGQVIDDLQAVARPGGGQRLR